MKKLVIVACAALVTACSGTPEIVDVYETVHIVPIDKVSPDVGGSYYGEMGDALLTYETGSYVAERNQKVTLVSGLPFNNYAHPGVEKGTTVQLAKSTEGKNAACFNNARYRGEDIQLCLYDLTGSGYFTYGQFDGSEISDIKVKYKVTSVDKHEASNEYLKRQLVYRGFSSGKMLFSYLEFAGRMDKPTREEEFKIDHQKNSHVLVGYKGARLKVMKADNVSIKFQLQANFK